MEPQYRIRTRMTTGFIPNKKPLIHWDPDEETAGERQSRLNGAIKPAPKPFTPLTEESDKPATPISEDEFELRRKKKKRSPLDTLYHKE